MKNKFTQMVAALTAVLGVTMMSEAAHAYSSSTNKTGTDRQEAAGVGYEVTIQGGDARFSSSGGLVGHSSSTSSASLKVGSKRWTILSHSATGQGLINWQNGNNPVYKEPLAAYSATLFGVTWFNVQAGSSHSPPPQSYDMSDSGQYTKTLENDIWSFTFLGVGFKAKALVTTTAGYELRAVGKAYPAVDMHSFIRSGAQAGPTGALLVGARITVGSDDLVSGGIQADFELAKIKTTINAENTIRYYSNATRKMDVTWINRAPIQVKSAGGAVKLVGCVLGGCGTYNVFSWNGFTTNKNLYNESGAQNNITAF